MEFVQEIGTTPAKARRRPAPAGRIAPAGPAATGPGPPHAAPGTRTSLKARHLLGIQGLEADEITLVLDTARVMAEIATRPVRKIPTLRAKTVVNFFMEPSTRTRSSFEIAEKRLSADTLNFSPSTSSVTKGESLLDTARNLEAMSPDMIVIRHKSSGAPHFLARHCRSAIINAGDGWHEHPTQALLDAYTIRERKGRLKGLTIAIVGDLMHSRVLRSNLFLLKTMGAQVRLCGPPTLVPQGLDALGAEVHLRVEPAIEGADVVMMLRVQRERQKGSAFPTPREYFNLFGMTRERVRLAQRDAIIMHPGPMNRGVEIASDVADGPASVILEIGRAHV